MICVFLVSENTLVIWKEVSHFLSVSFDFRQYDDFDLNSLFCTSVLRVLSALSTMFGPEWTAFFLEKRLDLCSFQISEL